MPTDCFTKKNSNSACMLRLLRDGKFRITAEQDELCKRAAEKAVRGYCARPRRQVLGEDRQGVGCAATASASSSAAWVESHAQPEDLSKAL